MFVCAVHEPCVYAMCVCHVCVCVCVCVSACARHVRACVLVLATLQQCIMGAVPGMALLQRRVPVGLVDGGLAAPPSLHHGVQDRVAQAGAVPARLPLPPPAEPEAGGGPAHGLRGGAGEPGERRPQLVHHPCSATQRRDVPAGRLHDQHASGTTAIHSALL